MGDLQSDKGKIFYLGIGGKIYHRDPFEQIEYVTFTRKELENHDGENEVTLETEEDKVRLKYRRASDTYILDHSKLERSITGSFRKVKSKSRNLDLD